MLILIRKSQQFLKQSHPFRFQFPRIHPFLRRLPPVPKIPFLCHIARRLPVVLTQEPHSLLIVFYPSFILCHRLLFVKQVPVPPFPCLVSPVGLKMTVEQNCRKIYSISRRTDDHRKPVLIPLNATKKTTPKQNTDRRPS